MLIRDLLNRLEIGKTNFQAVLTAISQESIIESLTITNPVSIHIDCKQGDKYHIECIRSYCLSVFRFIGPETILSESRLLINQNGDHFITSKFDSWICDFKFRVSELNVVSKKVRIRLIMILHWPISKQRINKRQINRLKLYKHQVIKLCSFSRGKRFPFFLKYLSEFPFSHVSIPVLHKSREYSSTIIAFRFKEGK